MKDIHDVVESALMEMIDSSMIEEAVCSILEDLDIEEMLKENYALKDAVIDSVNRQIDGIVEMYL